MDLTAELTAELTADCGRCAALCCVALPFGRGADFAIDKPAGVPCLHLASFRCSIHDRLRPAGFAGCAAFDCFGAGQRATASGRLAAFGALRVLHELLWYLTEALTWGTSLDADLRAALAATERLAELDTPDALGQRESVAPLLRSASALRRGPDAADRSGADLAGADLRCVDLARVSLRAAVLIGADLRGAILSRTDLLGADVRGADLRGADLRSALFVTRTQLGAARLDAAARVPARLATSSPPVQSKSRPKIG